MARNKQQNKVLSLVLTLALLLALLPAASMPARAAETAYTASDADEFKDMLRQIIEDGSGTLLLADAMDGAALNAPDALAVSGEITVTIRSASGKPVTLKPAGSQARHLRFNIASGASLTLIFEDVILDGDMNGNGIVDANDGGGIKAQGGGTLALVGAQIAYCYASHYGGGGVYADGAVTITNSTFENNKADDYGGGVYVQSMAKIPNSTLKNNVSEHGGGAYAGRGAVVSRCLFQDNTARFGGGMDSRGNTTITDSRFQGNSAAASGAGVLGDNTITIAGTAFLNNRLTSGTGTGAAISGGNQIIKGGNIFSGNIAERAGAAAYTESNIEISGETGEVIYIATDSYNAVHANGDGGTTLTLSGSPAFLYIAADESTVYSGNEINYTMAGDFFPAEYNGADAFAVVGTPKAEIIGNTLQITGLADISALTDFLHADDMEIIVCNGGTPLDIKVNQTGSAGTADLSALPAGEYELTVVQKLMGAYESAASDTLAYSETTVSGGSSSSGSSGYAVRFNANGGSAVAGQSVARGKKVTEPASPTREGYAFTGWYTDAALTTLYDFEKTVTAGFTLYAGWTAVSDEAEDDLGEYSHPAYISGYPNGTFRPEAILTRAEAATLFYNLAVPADAVRVTQFVEFPDVAEDAWYYTAVGELAGWDIISGYADGAFRREASITRAEFVTMAMRLAGSTSSGGGSFADVSASHWAFSDIAAAVNAGYVSGYPDGSFQPERGVTRAEAVSILNRIIECEGVAGGASFSDAPSTHWAYRDITAAATPHNH